MATVPRSLLLGGRAIWREVATSSSCAVNEAAPHPPTHNNLSASPRTRRAPLGRENFLPSAACRLFRIPRPAFVPSKESQNEAGICLDFTNSECMRYVRPEKWAKPHPRLGPHRLGPSAFLSLGHSANESPNLEMSRPGVQSSSGEGEAVSAPDVLGSDFAEGQDAADDEFDAFLRVILPSVQSSQLALTRAQAIAPSLLRVRVRADTHADIFSLAWPQEVEGLTVSDQAVRPSRIPEPRANRSFPLQAPDSKDAHSLSEPPRRSSLLPQHQVRWLGKRRRSRRRRISPLGQRRLLQCMKLRRTCEQPQQCGVKLRWSMSPHPTRQGPGGFRERGG